MAETKFNDTVNSLFKGMDSFITTKTVIGEAIHLDDTIILPMADVSFGVAAGAYANNAKNNAGGGMGGRIQPSAVLIIKDGDIRLMHVKNHDFVTKVIDMIPGAFDKVSDLVSGKHSSKNATDEEILNDVKDKVTKAAAEEAADETIREAKEL